MLKNVIFDMGNVLLSYDPEIPLNLFCTTREAKDLIRRELFEWPEWIQGDYGYITNEERYEPVSRRIPEEFHGQLRKCVDGWDICMQPVAGAMDFCRYVKDKGLGIYVLSNADTSFHEYFLHFTSEDFFDGVMVSSDVHMIKPERRIYEHFLNTFHLIPEECLFIDDRAENVEGAREVGIRGIVFQGDFESIRKNLSKHLTCTLV